MKRILILSGILFGVFALFVVLLGGTASANSLPEVEFLGEGPGSFSTTLDNFIVKRGEEQFDIEAGPTYQAASGERVWAVRGANEAPPSVFNGVVDLGWAYEGCTVEYVGIDDDVNGIRNGFFLGSSLVELVIEGMVFEGSYDVPVTSRDHRFVAEESVAGWYTPCVEPEPTATSTSTTEPEETPPPGGDLATYLPAIFDVGDELPPATETPTPTVTGTPPISTETPTATGTAPSPTETPTATATTEPAPEYNIVCDQEYQINIVDEEMQLQFSATAYENGAPHLHVDLKGTLDTGSQTPSYVRRTNFKGEAEFTVTVPVSSIEQAPVATVEFDDQGTYGNASCTVDFSTEVPPTPTPTPHPAHDFVLVCDPYYSVRFIGDEDVNFSFEVYPYYDSGVEYFPLPNVDLKAGLDAGGIMKEQVERSNFNGKADFLIEVLLTDITQTPLVTVTFDDQETFGDASCQIDSGVPGLFWTSLIERFASNK